MQVELRAEFANALPDLCMATGAAPAPDPRTCIINAELATELGINPDWLETAEGAAFLTGHGGSQVRQHPVAQKYAGHQFGGFSPLLGDGRAMLLGEIHTPQGAVRDLHLKGSGPTPLSRGDGMATLEATLREFLVSEAMHALGIPTTRSLGVATTGRRLMRDNYRHDNVLPGAVLTRVATSHVRVGTFQYARVHGDTTLLERLLRHAINRTAPELSRTPETPTPEAALAFLELVIDRQAALVAEWMLVGFVHGVMNTDNVLVSGETIDYGPCAFLDTYSPRAVFSSIDHGGRYAYGAQPHIMVWNLSRFADALLPLLDSHESRAIEHAEGALRRFQPAFSERWERGIRAKLGLAAESDGGPSQNIVSDLAARLFALMEQERMDFTLTFRRLTGIAAALGEEPEDPPLGSTPDAVQWIEDWKTARPDFFLMATSNPVTIPRNHHLQEVLDTAVDGDLGPYAELLQAVTDPFRERRAWAKFATPGEGGSAPFITYCGT